MTFIEMLRAKLKEKGLPEYLASIFKLESDDDVTGIMDQFGDVKPDDLGFEAKVSDIPRARRSLLTTPFTRNVVINYGQL